MARPTRNKINVFVLILGTDILAKTFWHRFFISMTFRHIDLWALWTFLQMVVSVDLFSIFITWTFWHSKTSAGIFMGPKGTHTEMPKEMKCPCQNISCQNFRCWNEPKPTTTREKLRAYCPNIQILCIAGFYHGMNPGKKDDMMK